MVFDLAPAETAAQEHQRGRARLEACDLCQGLVRVSFETRRNLVVESRATPRRAAAVVADGPSGWSVVWPEWRSWVTAHISLG